MFKSLIIALIVMGLYAQETQPKIDFYRTNDKKGVNVFEPKKNMDFTDFDGVRLRIGGHFTQQFQSLGHSNESTVKLIDIGQNFNNATANWSMDAQLAKGAFVKLETYLSSRHHTEAWVKGGYMQLDNMEFLGFGFIDKMMEYMRFKIGHMEINYGDAHFRRTDNGNAMYNPFVGNNILDAFTTEIGAEAYVFTGPFMGMIAVSNGEIKGDVTLPDNKEPSVYFKLAYDDQLNDDLRLRLSASFYNSDKSANNTLFGGDRSGSRYYYVMEKVGASASSQAFSGRFNPGFRDKVSANVINAFVKFQGLEVFASFDNASGRAVKDTIETKDRDVSQTAFDVVYRFRDAEDIYVGFKYNTVKGRLKGYTKDVSLNRTAFALGWYFTDNILVKSEYVIQKYEDYPKTNQLYKGKFDGLMLEAVIGF
jgi:hypothetical protein